MAKYTPVESKQRRGWFEIPGYSGYLARRDGFILNKKTGHSTRGGNAGHYLKVYVKRDDRPGPTLEYSHELICLAFKGPRPEGHVVLHKDNNRFNTKAINLEWGTQSQNIKDTYTDGLRLPTRGPRIVKPPKPETLSKGALWESLLGT